ncbi:MAG: phosphohistidine phosphatase [Frankiales bacterium]|nr:phosphohistidine phosphatase [Frankiales bacterium]
MPRLILLRHAKAEPHRTDDHARVLAPRGRADAAALRPLMVELVPELAVVSTSARTRETWALADPGGVAAVFDDRVYEASAADLREVLSELVVDAAVLVGHNPSVARLAWELEANDETNRGMRTSGVAVFEVADWSLDGARMTTFR